MVAEMSIEIRAEYVASIAELMRGEAWQQARGIYKEIVEKFGFVRIADEVWGEARKSLAAPAPIAEKVASGSRSKADIIANPQPGDKLQKIESNPASGYSLTQIIEVVKVGKTGHVHSTYRTITKNRSWESDHTSKLPRKSPEGWSRWSFRGYEPIG